MTCVESVHIIHYATGVSSPLLFIQSLYFIFLFRVTIGLSIHVLSIPGIETYACKIGTGNASMTMILGTHVYVVHL
jgi:hypothetical protein